MLSFRLLLSRILSPMTPLSCRIANSESMSSNNALKWMESYFILMRLDYERSTQWRCPCFTGLWLTIVGVRRSTDTVLPILLQLKTVDLFISKNTWIFSSKTAYVDIIRLSKLILLTNSFHLVLHMHNTKVDDIQTSTGS
jgi:hypothetical protein